MRRKIALRDVASGTVLAALVAGQVAVFKAAVGPAGGLALVAHAAPTDTPTPGISATAAPRVVTAMPRAMAGASAPPAVPAPAWAALLPPPTPFATPAASAGSTPAPAPTAQPLATAAAPGVYVVQPGDDLYHIAVKFGVSAAGLAQANGISDVNRVEVGALLRIRAR